MYKELKKEIINWLLDNEFEFQRCWNCIDHFRAYIYNNEGNYLIGGENVCRFIEEADKLIYGKIEEEE